MGENLLKVRGKVASDGVEGELEVGNEMPSLLARMFPRGALRSGVTHLIGKTIIDRIRNGEQLSVADAAYLDNLLKPAEAKWVRQSAICSRANTLLLSESRDARALAPLQSGQTDSESVGHGPEGGTTPADSITSAEWLNKFWDDAGLVDDEVLQEIYARILVSEARKPGACSMTTIQCLRYLDRRTADLFGKLLIGTVNQSWVPSGPQGDALLKLLGSTFSELLLLEDANLVKVSGELYYTDDQGPETYFRNGQFCIRVSAHGLRVRALALTTAGRDLARVAQVQFRREVAAEIARLLPVDPTSVKIAEMPNAGWEGRAEELDWNAP